MIKYLVFDVDNTLLDFNMSLFRAEKAIADRLGIPFTADYFTRAGEMIDAAWGERYFPLQFGCDISAEAVAQARSGNPSAQIKQNAKELPFRDNQFDIFFMIKSVSAVTPAMLDFILSEVKRVLRKGGSIFIVDFKPRESRRAVSHMRGHVQGAQP